MGDIQFGVLGPLTVWRDGEVVTPRSFTARAALGVLLLAENRPLAAGRVQALVRPEQPKSREWVQVLMCRLRTWLASTFGDSVSLNHRPDGYVLNVSPRRVDLGRFRSLSSTAAGIKPEQRLEHWEQAVRLWRGHTLADLDGVVGAGILEEFAELRRSAVLTLADEALQAGEPERALPHLLPLAREYPLDERVHAVWATLLAGAGRQGEALAVIQQIRRRLSDELGVDIGRHLHEAQRVVLRGLPHTLIGTARMSSGEETITALTTLLNADHAVASRLAHTLNGKRIALVVID
jgi:DNA-binding SARP family transcriptional activator